MFPILLATSKPAPLRQVSTFCARRALCPLHTPRQSHGLALPATSRRWSKLAQETQSSQASTTPQSSSDGGHQTHIPSDITTVETSSQDPHPDAGRSDHIKPKKVARKRVTATLESKPKKTLQPKPAKENAKLATPARSSRKPRKGDLSVKNESGNQPELYKFPGNIHANPLGYLTWAFKSPAKQLIPGDKKRMNILSEKLCDDVLDRLKPSLENHVGCDIVDINPGMAIWSKKLHDVLRPRTHILMEPDYVMYGDSIQSLLDEPQSTYKLVPESGIVWSELEKVLSKEHLPFQVELERDDPRLDEPNNSLLLIANLGYHPRRRYRGFDSVAMLLIFQFLCSIRTCALAQKYGQVRMLLWFADDEGRQYLPATIKARRKGAIEAEMCSSIQEIVCTSREEKLRNRGMDVDLEMGRRVMESMKAAGIEIPPGRETHLVEAINDPRKAAAQQLQIKPEWYQELIRSLAESKKNPKSAEVGQSEDFLVEERDKLRYEGPHDDSVAEAEDDAPLSGELDTDPTSLDEAYVEEKTLELESIFVSKKPPPPRRSRAKPTETALDILGIPNPEPEEPPKRKNPQINSNRKRQTGLKLLKYTENLERFRAVRYDSFSTRLETLQSLDRELYSPNNTDPDLDAKKKNLYEKMQEWIEEFEGLHRTRTEGFLHEFDDKIAASMVPPLLHWDRREFEPLRCYPNEFYPQKEMSLLDITPKPRWPILKDTENQDVLEYIMSVMHQMPAGSVSKALKNVWPGAEEWLLQECPTLRDPNKGGCSNLDLLRVRCMTLDMWKEIIEAWARWPFKPSRYVLLGRSGADTWEMGEDDAMETVSGSPGVGL